MLGSSVIDNTGIFASAALEFKQEQEEALNRATDHGSPETDHLRGVPLSHRPAFSFFKGEKLGRKAGEKRDESREGANFAVNSSKRQRGSFGAGKLTPPRPSPATL